MRRREEVAALIASAASPRGGASCQHPCELQHRRL